MTFVHRLLVHIVIVFAIQTAVFPACAFAEKVQDFSGTPLWFNTDQAIKLSNVRDHFVLLHFGIYSSANADWVIPELKKLSEKYSGDLVVIGVHAVKLFEQSVEDDIRQTIQIQNILYPVAVDANLANFKAFHISTLPTVVLISPDGKVLLRKSGSEVFQYIDKIFPKYLKEYSGKLSHKTLDFIDESKIVPTETQATPSVNLAQKLTSNNLIGPLVIDDVGELVREDGDVSQPFDMDPLIVTTQADLGDQPEKLPRARINFDEKSFVGDKIVIDREYSRQIGKINFSLQLPLKAQLSKTAKSFIRIFTRDGEVLASMELYSSSIDVLINEYIQGDRIYIEAAIYYVNERNGLLCSYQGLLYTVPLADYPKSENIELNYNIAIH